MKVRPVHMNEYAPVEPHERVKVYGEAICGVFSSGSMHTSDKSAVTCAKCRRLIKDGRY